jgi:hypothetical protein
MRASAYVYTACFGVFRIEQLSEQPQGQDGRKRKQNVKHNVIIYYKNKQNAIVYVDRVVLILMYLLLRVRLVRHT